MELTKRAAARTKKDHKVTFKVTSVVGSEDQSVRVISNPSATAAMRIDYFQLARKRKVDLLRYGLQVLLDWRLEVWNQMRQAAEEQYQKNLQTQQERRAELVQQIADYDALTLRRMEQEEIIKGVLRWLPRPGSC